VYARRRQCIHRRKTGRKKYCCRHSRFWHRHSTGRTTAYLGPPLPRRQESFPARAWAGFERGKSGGGSARRDGVGKDGGEAGIGIYSAPAGSLIKLSRGFSPLI